MKRMFLVLLLLQNGCGLEFCSSIEVDAWAGPPTSRRNPTSGSGQGRQASASRWSLNDFVFQVTTGQSNAMGSGSTPILSTAQPYDNLRWNNTALVDLVETGQESPTSGRANSMTFREPGRMSIAHQWGVGSKQYTDLKKGTSYYNNALAEVDEARDAVVASYPTNGFRVGPVLWVQGENDSLVGTSSIAYRDYMYEFQTDLQTDYRSTLGGAYANIPVMLSMVQLVNGSDDTPGSRTDDRIARGHEMAWKGRPNLITISHSPYFLDFQSDNLHFNNQGELLNGEYASNVDNAWMNGKAWVPLSISSATCDANTITLNYQGGADTSLCLVSNTSTVTRRPNLGFEYVERTPQNDRPVITNVTLPTCRSVQLTLDRNCDATGGVEYGYQRTSQATTGRTGFSGGGGNINNARPQRAQGLAYNLWDWAVMEHVDLTACTNCTASATWTFADTSSFKVDNSPVAFLSAPHITALDGATQVTFAWWRYSVSFNSGETAMITSNGLNQRLFDIRGTGTRQLRIFMPTSANDTGTYWTAASGAYNNSTRYLHIVTIDLTQAGNDAKLDVFQCTGAGPCTEISTAGTFTGTYPAAMTTGTRADLEVGASGGGSTQGVEGWFGHVAIWIGGAKWSLTEANELLNGGTKMDARLHSRGSPDYYWPLVGNTADVGDVTSLPLRPYGTTIVYEAMP